MASFWHGVALGAISVAAVMSGSQKDGTVAVKINGQPMNGKGIVVDGEVYVPANLVAKALGGTYRYSRESATADLTVQGLIFTDVLQERFPEGNSSSLLGYRETAIVVDDLPVLVKSALSNEDVDTLVSRRLTKMGVHVVDGTERLANYGRAEPKTERDHLKAADRVWSIFSVGATVHRSPSGEIHGVLSLDCDRGMLTFPGVYCPAAAWHSSTLLSWAKGADVKAQFQKALHRQLDEMEKEWKRANR